MSDTNVLHLITRFLDGGAETTTVNEIDALLDAEEDYHLHLGFGTEHEPERVVDVTNRGVETVCFDHLRHYKLSHSLPAVAQVARYLRANDVEVVHTHSTEAGIIGRWAGTLARTPVIIHEIHGDPFTDDRSTLLNGFVYAMERVSAPLATRIVVKSERIRDDFLRRGIGSEDQYELVYHGIETERFESAAPASLPESDASLRLLFVGRLVQGKGLFDLLDAFERVEEHHDVDLLLAGNGPLASDVRTEIRERGIEDSAIHLGYRTDIPQVLAASDVLVLPSYREGTPRVISEALAAGLPVVATRIAGIPEQVPDGECGLLVDPGDVDALVQALDTLLESDSRREEMSRESLEHVKKFSVDHSQQEVRRLYRRLGV